MEIPGVPREEVDEVLQLLEAYERSGRSLGEMPEDLQTVLNGVKRAKGQPTDETETEDIVPDPGFVVKTTDQNGTKVFINVCHSKQVPAPGGWQNGMMPDKVLKALDDLQHDQPNSDAEALRFPLSCSEVQPDTDKQGQPCSTIDCIVHSDVLAAAQQHRPLKAFLIELALQWAGSKHQLKLDQKFKLPKMTYKGLDVRPQRVRLDKKQLVTDITMQSDDEPTFPLLPNKQAAKAATSKSAATAALKAGASAAASQKIPTTGSAGSSEARSHSAAGRTANGTANATSSKISSHNWQHELQLQGKPVTHMIVTISLPQRDVSSSSSSSSSWKPTDWLTEVCGQQLRVRPVPAGPAGIGECLVQLPFSASGAEGTAELRGSGQLVVELPYQPVQEWLQQLKAAAPHAFAQLPVKHAAYMELDEFE